MRYLVLAGFLLLILGVFFARERLKRAFQIGAVIYAIILVFRFLYAGSDDVLDILTLGAIFFVIWLVAKAIVEAVLHRREREAAHRAGARASEDTHQPRPDDT